MSKYYKDLTPEELIHEIARMERWLYHLPLGPDQERIALEALKERYERVLLEKIPYLKSTKEKLAPEQARENQK